MTFLTLEMTSNVVDSDTVKRAVLNNPYVDPELVSLALPEVIQAQNGPKLAKFGNLTLKYDLLTLKMTSGAIENDSIELAVLKNPDIDTKLVSLALLQKSLLPRTQVNPSDSS